MVVYRIEKAQYAHEWPSRGSLFAEGRWNRKGFWVVYCSFTIALAKLETLANSKIFPANRVVLEISVNDEACLYT